MASDPPLEASSTTASSASSANKANESTTSQHAALSSTTHVSTVFPNLPSEMQEVLLAETVHAVAAIGGHENPPARHIVGFEAVASVKEKLKTVSEELEDFVGVSGAVDVEVRNGG